MTKNIFYILIFALLIPISTIGQDIAFSQFYSNPLSINPALTGNTECGRITTAYRNQWTGIPKAYNTYHLTYDQSISNINSGFGFIIYNDRQADNALNTFSGSALYSFHFNLSSETVVNLGLQATYNQTSLDWSNLVFSDQIQLNGEIASVSNESVPSNKNVSYMDFSTGFAFDWKEKLYGGFAVHHLSEPVNSFYDEKYSVLPMKYTIHGGAFYDFGAGNETFVVSPNILFQQQGKFHQLNFGAYVKVSYFVIGGWFRHNLENPDAMIALVGFKKDNFKVGYSYDFTLSELSVNTGGSHEFTLSYEFCIYTNSKKRKIRAIKCPEF